MREYKFQGYFRGTEDDADAMRKWLAQSIADEFEVSAVFGIAIQESMEQQEPDTV